MSDNVDVEDAERGEGEASTSSYEKPTKRAKRSVDINTSLMSSAFEMLKNAAQKLDKQPTKANEVDCFFTYVASKVNNYSPEVQKSVQHAIFDILVKADKGQYDQRAHNYNNFNNNWQSVPVNEPPPMHYNHYNLQPLQPVSIPNDDTTVQSAQPSPADSVISGHFSDFVWTKNIVKFVLLL